MDKFNDSSAYNSVISQFTDFGGVSPYGGLYSDEYLEHLMSNPILNRVVTLLPTDATKFDPYFTVNGVESDYLEQMLYDSTIYSSSLEQDSWTDCLRDALIYSRLYGDGFIIVGYSDTSDLSKPVKPSSQNRILWMSARNKKDLTINQKDKVYQLHSLYSMEGQANNLPKIKTQITNIHPSRVIRFKGTTLYGQVLAARSYYNESILTGILCSYNNYTDSLNAIVTMVKSHSAFTYGVNDLSIMAKNGKLDLLKSRFQGMLDSIRKIGGIAYDKTNEQVSYLSRNYSNIDKLILLLKDDLLAVSGLPEYKLWGKVEGNSLSSGGDAQKEDYRQIVNTYQYSVIDNKIMLMLKPCLEPQDRLTIQFEKVDSLEEEDTYESTEGN